MHCFRSCQTVCLLSHFALCGCRCCCAPARGCCFRKSHHDMWLVDAAKRHTTTQAPVSQPPWPARDVLSWHHLSTFDWLTVAGNLIGHRLLAGPFADWLLGSGPSADWLLKPRLQLRGKFFCPSYIWLQSAEKKDCTQPLFNRSRDSFGGRISSDFVCIFCFQLVSTAWWLWTGILTDLDLHCVKHQNIWHSVIFCDTFVTFLFKTLMASFDHLPPLVKKNNSLNVVARHYVHAGVHLSVCVCLCVCVCVCVCTHAYGCGCVCKTTMRCPSI